MKKLLLSGLLCLLASSAQAVVTINGAETITGSVTVQGTSIILSTETLQAGATIYISSGTVRNQFTFGRIDGNADGLLLDGASSGVTMNYYPATGPAVTIFNKLRISNSNFAGANASKIGFSFRNGSDGVGMVINPANNSGSISMSRTVTVSSAATFSDSVTVSSGALFTNYLRLPNKTSAEINAISPGDTGWLYYCTDCVAGWTCVSTGTARGAFRINSVATSCQ